MEQININQRKSYITKELRKMRFINEKNFDQKMSNKGATR